MKAVICDVYRTLLDVGPPPPDAERRWQELCLGFLNVPPPDSLPAHGRICAEIIATDHSEANRRGIAFPEVCWAAVMKRALPAVGALPPDRRMQFIRRHMALLRTLRLASGAGDFLRLCADRGLTLGIISNAQPYTPDELAEALASDGLAMGLFHSTLCIWSFEQGFSKPDPYIFQALTARLALMDISPADALLVGDRQDNDILPGRDAGLQTWHFSASQSWTQLARHMRVL